MIYKYAYVHIRVVIGIYVCNVSEEVPGAGSTDSSVGRMEGQDAERISWTLFSEAFKSKKHLFLFMLEAVCGLRACMCERDACAHVCVRACVRACVNSCVRASTRASMRACVRACVRASAFCSVILACVVHGFMGTLQKGRFLERVLGGGWQGSGFLQLSNG